MKKLLRSTVPWLMLGVLVPIIVLFGIQFSQASAVEIHVCYDVSCPYDNIQAAIDDASSGDTIKVAAGVYTGVHTVYTSTAFTSTQVVYIDKNLSLLGCFTTTNWTTPTWQTNPTSIDSQGLGRGIVIKENAFATIGCLSIENSDATGLGGGAGGVDAGGGLYAKNAGGGSFTELKLVNNQAQHGGGMYLTGGNFNIFDSTIFNNNAITDFGVGGGIYFSGATIFMDSSYIYLNSSKTMYSNCAGMYINASTGTLQRNEFFGNTAAQYGGGLCVQSGSMHISSNTFEGNQSTISNGGGLYIGNTASTLLGNDFIDNSAYYDGGGVFIGHGTSLEMLYNNFTGNVSGRNGGGISLRSNGSTIVTATQNFILENNAVYGGGMHNASSILFSFNNYIYRNSASKSGGAVYASSYIGTENPATTTLSVNSIISNTAVEEGGGFYSGEYSSLIAKNNLIDKNLANFGAGIYTVITGTALIEDNQITNNEASATGGGIFNGAKSLEFNDNHVHFNTAPSGAGVFIHYDSNATLSRNFIQVNDASIHGGGVYAKGAVLTMVNNVVGHNTAVTQGPGIMLAGVQANILHSTIISNTSANTSAAFVLQDYIVNSTTYTSSVHITNTIITNQPVGFVLTGNGNASVNSVIWHDFIMKTTPGPVYDITFTNEYTGDPLIIMDGYHIAGNSPAMNKGVETWVTRDIDGDMRAGPPDLGVDEISMPTFLPIIFR